MRRLACLPLLFLLLGCLLGLPRAARAEPSALAGSWAGGSAEAPVELSLEPRGQGFAVRLVSGGRALFDALFSPSGRPGVFEAAATGLFAMLGTRRAPANPLEGEELVWARSAPGGLVLSRLAIAGGRPAIERARLVREGERVRLQIERLVGERLVQEADATLARTGR